MKYPHILTYNTPDKQYTIAGAVNASFALATSLLRVFDTSKTAPAIAMESVRAIFSTVKDFAL